MAHDIGLSPSQYNQVVNLYVANELAMMPDKKAEVAKLGESEVFEGHFGSFVTLYR